MLAEYSENIHLSSSYDVHERSLMSEAGQPNLENKKRGKDQE